MEKNVYDDDSTFVSSSCRKKARVAVLLPSYACSESIFKTYDLEQVNVDSYNPSPLDYSFETFMILKPTAVEQVTNLVLSNKFDIFLNLCDGDPNGDTAGVEVILCLENLKAPYTGANSKFYAMTKAEMKSVANSCDVPTPAYAFVLKNDVNSIEHVNQRCREILLSLEFPLIVKHYNGAGSLGMTERSKVQNQEELEEEVLRTVEEFGGALVEEFVRGREFTVLVAENPYDANNPTIYEPVECLLPSVDAFKHFQQKFIDYQSITWIPVNDIHLANNLKLLTKKIFVGSQANSFARCDFRMCSKTNTIYFLEINAQCGVFYPKGDFGSADFILDLCKSHETFVENLLLSALVSFERNNNVAPPSLALLNRSKKVQIEQPPIVHAFADEIVL